MRKNRILTQFDFRIKILSSDNFLAVFATRCPYDSYGRDQCVELEKIVGFHFLICPRRPANNLYTVGRAQSVLLAIP